MSKRHLLLLLSLWLYAITASAQVYTVQGTVRDATTREKLPFVSVVVNEGETGTTTNLEGQYQLRHSHPITSLRFSYVGYAPQTVVPDSVSQINIALSPAAAQIKEVVIRSGVNPAHRIIQLANQNRERHRTENIPAYTYRTYNKFILTATAPADLELSDTLSLSSQDSSTLRMRDLLAKQHLFLMESITDYAHLSPNFSKETILATRVSGLQQPSFGVVAAEAREFSVYDDMPVFFGKRYLSPLSTGSIRKYDFVLQEAAVVGSDTVFIISYAPQPGKNFDGLKGLLYINSDGWAVQNVIAESPADEKRGLKLQQQFVKVDNRQWFPAELDVELTVQQIYMRGHQPFGHIRTYITNVNLNPPLRRSDFNVIALEQQPNAWRQPEQFWQQYRPDSLSIKEQVTYQRLDSVGKEQKLDRTIRTMEYLVAKQLPIGPISLDLNRLFKVSRFEGMRLGIGAHTNDLLSERFSVGGYWGYGLRDQEHKYGADAAIKLHKPSELTLSAAFAEDVQEPGGRRLPFRERSLLSDLRPAVLPYLDYTTQRSATLSGRVLRYVQLQTGIRQEQRRPTLPFFTPEPEVPQPEYNITEATLGMRFAYGEQYMRLFNRTMPLATPYPVLWLQYTQGIDAFGSDGYTYNRLDLRAEGTFRQRSLGETTVTLVGGLVQGNAPFVSLYNGYGSYSSNYKVYAGEGFETMRPYEFFADRYAALFLRQDLGKRLIRTKIFKPDLVLVQNIGIGDLRQTIPELSTLEYSDMRKGFFESGLMLNNVISSAFSGIGVGAFYRYGPYALPDAKDNLKLKLTATLAF
ncbi:carboxypeptidase-like regulatory domain-containing protein [Pontibacter sp. JH31]|uniref:Carboxypeptidase-like regulatory domain-containing protein n=1 Tax=Pontibacter aquaedesilientis TaxID=2766980 RepID=A0ABR7XG20_9BACT|nr:DUF5686 and carboxypeptidase-like regulatory domain-containing protein [Pontibacter aquaedesilientis]MBD1397244.1 carboxypeptidase-like regulatory domain-containing protein [Pontibacter aquaedesilientis]